MQVHLAVTRSALGATEVIQGKVREGQEAADSLEKKSQNNRQAKGNGVGGNQLVSKANKDKTCLMMGLGVGWAKWKNRIQLFFFSRVTWSWSWKCIATWCFRSEVTKTEVKGAGCA